MDDPRTEQMADDGDRNRPDFDALAPSESVVRGERTRDDFFDAALAIDKPATASEVADLAGRGVDAAREYLAWFERLGVVTRVTDSPATYRRNQAYLDWRRVQRIREEHTSDRLVELLETETERAAEYADRFDAESPDDVSITAHASATDRSVEAVWEDLSTWRTARRRIGLLERALRPESGANGPRTTA